MQSDTVSYSNSFLESFQNPPFVHPLLALNSIFSQRDGESTKIDFSGFDALLEFLISSPVVPPKMIEDVITGIVLIKAFLMDSPHKFVKDYELQIARSVVGNVGSFFFSFDLNKMNEFMALQLCSQLRNYFRRLEDTPTFQRFRVYRPIIKYPKTSAFVFINHLLENLDELLKDTTSSTGPFNYFILRVQMELRFWYSDLIEISSDPPLFLKKAIETITKLAYDVEYALDLFLVGDLTSWRCICLLNDIFLHFLQIEQERRTSEDEKEDLKGKKTMVKDKLLGGNEQLNIITIVGPEGIGKEALAMELYNSPSVISHFESRAYCSPRLVYSHNDITKELLELLGNFDDLSDEIRSKNNEELTKLLFKSLEGPRFLVVIECNNQAFDIWNIIQRWFPDSNNGSRIVLIIREKEFAFTDKSKSIRQLQSPQDDPIWESLFQRLSCHDEMLEVRMKIAKRCKPESKIFVVHLLQTIRKTMNKWEEVANTLGSRAFGYRGSQVYRILDLTCFYLPDHLRSCFFYMGVFLSEYAVVSKLIRLWIAEGFVKHTASQSLEKTGEDYVVDLISRNLLGPIKENMFDKATYIHHDVVRNFLSRKVKEDNFLQIEEYNSSSSSSSSSLPTICYQRRLWTNSRWDEFVVFSGPFLQSLFWTDFNDSGDISFIYKKFKFLRILNIEHHIIGDSFLEVGVLVLLRFLAVQSSVKFIPPSISNLWNLETFLFRQSNDEVVQVPDCIWDMTKLRHFCIYSSSSSFDLDPHRLENSSSILDNLQTFSKPILSYGDNMEKILRRLPSIKKLKCVFLDSWDDDTNCNRFPMLGILNKLVSLTVSYNGVGKYPCQFNLPTNLKKLTLIRFGMPWNEISQLAMLKNLEVLKLENDAFEGVRWEMEDHVVFPKLKYLKLAHMRTVEYWSATCHQFPQLEHLVLVNCKKIVEIPQDFAYITSIRRVEVKYCTPFAEKSVRLIQQQHVKHWGHDELKISCEYYDSEF